MEMELFSNVMGSSLIKGKRSKRLRPWFSAEEQQGLWSYGESTQEDEHDSEEEEMAAHSLMLLSQRASAAADHVPSPTPTPILIKRVMKKPKEFHSADPPYEGGKTSSYECKTCSKRFLSFQALGGHRSSCCHSTNSADDTTAESEQANEKSSESNKMKVHICPICCRVFSSGQALGGHKRTHSPATPPTHSAATENGYEQRAELDLNMPAPLDDSCTQTEDSSAVPCSTAVRSHYNEYKLNHPFWWMNSAGKRIPIVYNGGAAGEADSRVVLGQDLGLNQDLFMVATAN